MNARRATLRVTARCDNACVSCPQSGLSLDEPEGLRDALASLRADHDELTLTGGEPLLHEGLDDVVRAARALGFARVGVQTNGRRLRARAEGLARAGLTDVHVSVHGAEAGPHDYHTGVEGSFVETAAGLAAARAQGLTAVVETVLTRSNFRALAELPRWLSSRGVAAWVVDVPHAAGRALEGFDRVIPRLAMATPAALHALAAAQRLGLAAWVRGAPLCLLGPYASRALEAPARAYGEACAACPARPRCPGVDPRYLARFEGDELSAARAPVEAGEGAGARGEREARLARMFTGAGPLATEAPEPQHIAARPRRVALPLHREG